MKTLKTTTIYDKPTHPGDWLCRHERDPEKKWYRARVRRVVGPYGDLFLKAMIPDLKTHWIFAEYLIGMGGWNEWRDNVCSKNTSIKSV